MNTNLVQSYESGENLVQHARVRLNSSAKVIACTAALTAECIGHNVGGPTDYTLPGRKMAAVQVLVPGTQQYAIAAGAIALGAEFKANDDGKIQTIGASGSAEGRALEAAAGAGSVIRVAYYLTPITRS